MHESQLHEANSFLTLTYDEEHLPENLSVDVREVQLFLKRLRKRMGFVRFFACGEYGEKTLRPHYHMLLFGQDFAGDREVIREKPFRLWKSSTLDSVWGKGHASIGALTYETAAYTARYVMKKKTGDQAKEAYERVDAHTGEVFDVKPEFVTMSRRPGIAAEWFKKFRGDVFPSDEVVIDGRRSRPPRFYDERLPEGELQAVKKKRRKRVAARASELTDERLQVRERVLAANLQKMQRKL